MTVGVSSAGTLPDGEPTGQRSLRRLPPVALYLHAPFCVSRCPYCDFVVYAGADARGPRSRVAPFVRAVAAELELRADELDRLDGRERPPLESVYLGGGTPSLLAAQDVAGLLAIIRRRYGIASGAEVSLEANPGPDERGDLAGFRQAGVTRLSIGAQSFDRGELRRLGRRHAPEDVREAVAAARAAGFASISLDLLYDLPGQSVDRWAATLEAALALAPDHLSLYALTLDDPEAEGLTGETGDHLPTPLGARRWRERAVQDQDEDLAAECYRHASVTLAEAGWRGYEISNWARAGHESRHNLAYWRRLPYEAVGPGAHAFDGQSRRWNAARLDRYVAALAPADGSRSGLPPGGQEALEAATERAEEVILSLRLDSGVPLGWASEPPLAVVAAWGEEAGLLERFELGGAARLRLTLRGRLLSNEVFRRLV